MASIFNDQSNGDPNFSLASRQQSLPEQVGWISSLWLLKAQALALAVAP